MIMMQFPLLSSSPFSTPLLPNKLNYQQSHLSSLIRIIFIFLTYFLVFYYYSALLTITPLNSIQFHSFLSLTLLLYYSPLPSFLLPFPLLCYHFICYLLFSFISSHPHTSFFFAFYFLIYSLFCVIFYFVLFSTSFFASFFISFTFSLLHPFLSQFYFLFFSSSLFLSDYFCIPFPIPLLKLFPSPLLLLPYCFCISFSISISISTSTFAGIEDDRHLRVRPLKGDIRSVQCWSLTFRCKGLSSL